MRMSANTSKLSSLALILCIAVLLLVLGALPLERNLSLVNTALARELTQSSIDQPATYYGFISPTIGFAPAAGMAVTAEISGTNCGSTTIQELSGTLGYSILVLAEDTSAGLSCGTSGATIAFRVDGIIMSDTVAWDNLQANPFDLSMPFNQEISASRNSDDLQLSWPTHPAVCVYDVHRSGAPYFVSAPATFVISGTNGSFVDSSVFSGVGSLYYRIDVTDCNGGGRELGDLGLFRFVLEPGNS